MHRRTLARTVANRLKSRPNRPTTRTKIALITVAAASVLFLTRGWWVGPVGHLFSLRPEITKEHIATALSESVLTHRLPDQLVLDLEGRAEKTQVQYSFDESLQAKMQSLFESYKPDYGAFVAIDATTGRILSLISYNPIDPWIKDHLALRATFPSASVFKVVTAAAAISERKLSADSMMSYNGRAHTLYKRNIFKETVNRWTNRITLKDAFAKSVNTVFGKMGVFIVGPSELRTYADRFGFNRKIGADLPVQQGHAEITEDPWEVAEAASGFTRANTMSPLQGALIAASIANDGVMMEPYIVDSLSSEDGQPLYQAKPTISETVIDAHAANEMKELMRETIVDGTSRSSFRGFKRSPYGFIDVGGKTGSLTGNDPQGKYDWFVGYATSDQHKVAFATLTISKEYWKVKSAFLTRKAIEYYFKDRYAHRLMAENRSIAAKSRYKYKRVHYRAKQRRR